MVVSLSCPPSVSCSAHGPIDQILNRTGATDSALSSCRTRPLLWTPPPAEGCGTPSRPPLDDAPPRLSRVSKSRAGTRGNRSVRLRRHLEMQVRFDCTRPLLAVRARYALGPCMQGVARGRCGGCLRSHCVIVRRGCVRSPCHGEGVSCAAQTVFSAARGEGRVMTIGFVWLSIESSSLRCSEVDLHQVNQWF